MSCIWWKVMWLHFCTFQATKVSTGGYVVQMNGSSTEADAHRMADGSLLVSVDGSSYSTYMRDEVSSYRIVIGNKTCIFEKENDPTMLRYISWC